MSNRQKHKPIEPPSPPKNDKAQASSSLHKRGRGTNKRAPTYSPKRSKPDERPKQSKSNVFGRLGESTSGSSSSRNRLIQGAQDLQAGKLPNREQSDVIICRNFQKFGKCDYGERCLYKHVSGSSNEPKSQPRNERDIAFQGAHGIERADRKRKRHKDGKHKEKRQNSMETDERRRGPARDPEDDPKTLERRREQIKMELQRLESEPKKKRRRATGDEHLHRVSSSDGDATRSSDDSAHMTKFRSQIVIPPQSTLADNLRREQRTEANKSRSKERRDEEIDKSRSRERRDEEIDKSRSRERRDEEVDKSRSRERRDEEIDKSRSRERRDEEIDKSRSRERRDEEIDKSRSRERRDEEIDYRRMHGPALPPQQQATRTDKRRDNRPQIPRLNDLNIAPPRRMERADDAHVRRERDNVDHRNERSFAPRRSNEVRRQEYMDATDDRSRRPREPRHRSGHENVERENGSDKPASTTERSASKTPSSKDRHPQSTSPVAKPQNLSPEPEPKGQVAERPQSQQSFGSQKSSSHPLNDSFAVETISDDEEVSAGQEEQDISGTDAVALERKTPETETVPDAQIEDVVPSSMVVDHQPSTAEVCEPPATEPVDNPPSAGLLDDHPMPDAEDLEDISDDGADDDNGMSVSGSTMHDQGKTCMPDWASLIAPKNAVDPLDKQPSSARQRFLPENFLRTCPISTRFLSAELIAKVETQCNEQMEADRGDSMEAGEGFRFMADTGLIHNALVKQKALRARPFDYVLSVGSECGLRRALSARDDLKLRRILSGYGPELSNPDVDLDFGLAYSADLFEKAKNLLLNSSR